MKEHFYAFYVFTVQNNGGVAPPPPLVDFEDLPYPRGRSYTPRFCIKMTAKDARAVIKKSFCVNIARFKVSGKNLEGWGVVTLNPRQTRVKGDAPYYQDKPSGYLYPKRLSVSRKTYLQGV